MIRLALVFLVAASLFAQESHGGIKDVGIGWKWANFAILCAVLGYFISKHAGPFFQARTEQIQSGIREATKMKEEADRKVADIERRVANLENELASMREKAREEMEHEAERIRTETARQMAKTQTNSQNEILSAAKSAKLELKNHAAELAVQLAAAQVKQRLTPEVQEQLVGSFVADVAKSSKN